eukprot:7315884-Prymnesium_polylepis.1
MSFLTSLLASSLAFQPAFQPSVPVAARPAVSLPAARAPSVLMASEEKRPPTLGGEKLGVAMIAVAVGYTLGSAGVTPAAIWAAPGGIVRSPILQKAAKRAIGGGLSGAIAGVIQVLTLMWLRT